MAYRALSPKMNQTLPVSEYHLKQTANQSNFRIHIKIHAAYEEFSFPPVSMFNKLSFPNEAYTTPTSPTQSHAVNGKLSVKELTSNMGRQPAGRMP